MLAPWTGERPDKRRELLLELLEYEAFAEHSTRGSCKTWHELRSWIQLTMKSLQEIKSFPASHREVLEGQFGITSPEAFYEHATRNAQGMQTALELTPAQLAALLKLVEGYLTAEFVKRCRQPVAKHGRGVIEGGKKGSGVFCRNGPKGASHKRLPTLPTPFSDREESGADDGAGRGPQSVLSRWFVG